MILSRKVSRYFLSFIAALSLLISPVSAVAKGYWGTVDEVELKKDETIEVKVFNRIRDKSLYFRWTLYINSGLVVISHYDRFPHQYVLYKKDYRRDSFRVRLDRNRSEILVQFLDFNEKKNRAKFKIFSRNANIEVVR